MRTIREEPWFESWREFTLTEEAINRKAIWKQLGIKGGSYPLSTLSDEDLVNLLRGSEVSNAFKGDLKDPQWGWDLATTFLEILTKTGTSPEDPVGFRVLVNSLIYLTSRTLAKSSDLAKINSLDDLVLTARTTPPTELEGHVRGGRAMDYYGDLMEDEVFLRTGPVAGGYSVWNTAGNLLFALHPDADGLFQIEDAKTGTMLSPDQFLEQVPDAIEDGVKYLGITLSEL